MADSDYRRLQPQCPLVQSQLRLQPIERQDRYLDMVGFECDIGIHRLQPAKLDFLVREHLAIGALDSVPFAAACSPSCRPVSPR